MSQIVKKFIGDDQVADEKIRLDNNSSLRWRNAANSADLSVLTVDGSDNAELDTVELNIGDILNNPYWGTSSAGFRGKQTGTYDHIVFGCYDQANNSTANGLQLSLQTGKKPGASSTNPTGSIYIHTGDNEGSGQSGYLNIDTGATSGAGPSGDMDIFTGAASGAGASGYLILKSGNSSGSAGNTGPVSLFSGTCSATTGNTGYAELRSGNSTNGNSGDLLLTVGTAGGTQGSFKFLKTGVASVVGQVWTASGTDGTGYWANATGATNEKETFTLSAGDITNGYIDLANVAKTDSIDFVISGIISREGTDYTVSYTGGAGGNTRITFSAHTPALVATDVVTVKYQY